MAAESPPFVIQASSHSAALFRQTISAILGLSQPGSLTVGAGGVINGTATVSGDLFVEQNGTPNMSVNVLGGVVMIPQTLAANGGVYTGLNDATVNLTIAASNPTNPRIDIIVATAQDAAYAGSTNNWILQVITGTPAASPSQPSTPSSSVLLASVLVPANSTSVTNFYITDKRPFVTFSNSTRGNPAGLIYPTTGQSIVSGTPTFITYQTDLFLRGGMTQSASQLVFPVSGYYLLGGTCTLGGASGTLSVTLYVEGSPVGVTQGATNSAPSAIECIALTYAEVGWVSGLNVEQTMGATYSTYNSSPGYVYNSMWAYLVST